MQTLGKPVSEGSPGLRFYHPVQSEKATIHFHPAIIRTSSSVSTAPFVNRLLHLGPPRPSGLYPSPRENTLSSPEAWLNRGERPELGIEKGLNGQGRLKRKISSLSKGGTHPATATLHFGSEEGDLIGCVPVSKGSKRTGRTGKSPENVSSARACWYCVKYKKTNSNKWGNAQCLQGGQPALCQVCHTHPTIYLTTGENVHVQTWTSSGFNCI